MTPRSASNSSTSRYDSAKRWHQRAAHLIASGGNRNPVNSDTGHARRRRPRRRQSSPRGGRSRRNLVGASRPVRSPPGGEAGEMSAIPSRPARRRRPAHVQYRPCQEPGARRPRYSRRGLRPHGHQARGPAPRRLDRRGRRTVCRGSPRSPVTSATTTTPSSPDSCAVQLRACGGHREPDQDAEKANLRTWKFDLLRKRVLIR